MLGSYNGQYSRFSILQYGFDSRTQYEFKDLLKFSKSFCLYDCPAGADDTDISGGVRGKTESPNPLYKARSGFSILTEECLTFRTTSPLRRVLADAHQENTIICFVPDHACMTLTVPKAGRRHGHLCNTLIIRCHLF